MKTTTDLTAAMDELDALTLQSLMDEAVEYAPRPPTSKARSEQIAKAITDKDLSELLALQERLHGIIDQIVANNIDVDDLSVCDDARLYSLMVELLDQKDIERLLKVRYAMIRAQIFHHITQTNKDKGISEPERAPGEAAVPRLYRKFTREGGRLKASLDQEKLRKALGSRRWKKVTREVTVPAVEAHTELVLDEDKVLELVKKDPKVLELFRECVQASGYTPQSLHVRTLGEP